MKLKIKLDYYIEYNNHNFIFPNSNFDTKFLLLKTKNILQQLKGEYINKSTGIMY